MANVLNMLLALMICVTFANKAYKGPPCAIEMLQKACSRNPKPETGCRCCWLKWNSSALPCNNRKTCQLDSTKKFEKKTKGEKGFINHINGNGCSCPKIHCRDSNNYTYTISKDINYYTDEVDSRVLNLTTTFNNGSTLSAGDIVQHVDAIENDLATLALSLTNSNTSQIGTGTFEIAVRSLNQSKAGEFDVGNASVRLRLAQGSLAPADAFVAQVDLPKEAMSKLIQRHNASKNDPEVLETTGLFPDTPFLSASAFAFVVPGSSPANITFTFSIADQGKLEATATAPALQGRARLSEIRPTCSFIDPELQGLSQRGCKLVPTSDKGNVTCECNHTTMFAVLLTTRAIVVPNGVQTMSNIAGITSVVFLIFTLMILVALKESLQSDRTGVQTNLCFALLFFHFFSLFQDLALANSRACELVTVLIHYFLLASGGCMSCEAMFLLLKTSKKSLEYAAKRQGSIRRIMLFVSWLLPGLIVGLSAIVGFSIGVYMDDTQAFSDFAVSSNTTIPRYIFCWIGASSGIRVPAVVFPMLFSWVFNVFAAIRITLVVLKMHRGRQNYVPQDQQQCVEFGENEIEEMMVVAKAILMLMPVFGISWIFAFLAGTPDKLASTAFLYLNAIFNGLQGFFLFLVYCVLNQQTRDLLKRKIKSNL